MYLRILEQQLKKQGWISNFKDSKMSKKLCEQTADALSDQEKVYSLTSANKIDAAGKPTVSEWLLVLTRNDLFFVEFDSDEDFWHSAPQRIELDDIRSINSEESHLNPSALRISIISSEKALVFESIDFDSAFHFVNKAKDLLEGDVETMNDETLNLTKSHDFQDLETINTTQTKKFEDDKDKKNKNHQVFNYFFNFSSLFKSLPAMEVLYLIFQLVWIICDVIFIALVDASSINRSGEISLGVIMLTFNILAIGILIPYIINIWKKGTITNKSKIFITIEMMMVLLMIVSITIITDLISSFVFSIVGLFIGFLVITWVSLEFIRKLVELQAENETKA